jgi:preprotein translocase subunit SecB
VLLRQYLPGADIIGGGVCQTARRLLIQPTGLCTDGLCFNFSKEKTMADQEPVFQIQRVYLKEASLEQPNSPAILLDQEQPSVDIQLGVEANPVAEGIFEVCVTATVQTKIQDKTVFLVEVKQAGIFEIRNLAQEQMGQIMGIACPQIVYPYLRGNVADLIQRGGFPPVHLAEINFQAMYEQQQNQAAQMGEAATLPQ